MVIKDQTGYEEAAGLLKTIKAMANNAETARKSIVDPINKAKDAVQALFNPITTRLENSERHIKGLMIAYSNEQERIRLENEEKLRKQAQAEEDRKKKALLARADKATAAGNTDKAEDLQQQAQEVYVPAPTLASTVQRPAGISIKKIWKARVIDASLVPRAYLMIDEKKLDQQAKATQKSLPVPGVDFYTEDVMASR
jgi:hypothetical protein